MDDGSVASRDTRIRAARPQDAGLIVGYVRSLAEFEKEPLENVLIDEEAVLAHAFGEHPKFEVIIAERHGTAAGMALFFKNYSTWTAKPGIWVEELFVEEQHRKHGVGNALMREIARIAASRGCGRVELAALRWNPATEFYRHLGFEALDGWQTYRLDAAGIASVESRPTSA